MNDALNAYDSRPELVFTFPACMGGVSSLNYNLLNYATQLGQFRSKVILLREKERNEPEFLDSFAVDETVRFDYSNFENQYAVIRRLGAELGSRPGAIVCENLLTMAAAAESKCPKTVFHFLHDFAYVKTNMEAGALVDVAVSHSTFFADAAFSADPGLFAGRTFYLPYGVSQETTVNKNADGPLNLVFLGRLVEKKGVKLLPRIDRELRARGVVANWRIIGKGPLRGWLEAEWPERSAITFHAPDSTPEVFSLLGDQDIFVFPTEIEGTPVSILETLAHGVVSVVSDLPGGIRDIITPDVGVRVPLGHVTGFADAIVRLAADRDELRTMQERALTLARTQFDIRKNANAYIELFARFAEFRRADRHAHYKFGKLDQRWIPNAGTFAARTLLGRLRG